MNWRPFDAKSFLKASRHWKNDIIKLEQKLKDISYLPSHENETGIRSGDIADPPAQLAIKRIQIQEQIDEIKNNEKMLDFALKSLTDEERQLIDGFFYPKRSIGYFVQDYGRRHGLCKDYVYAERERVLKKISDIIEKEYY